MQMCMVWNRGKDMDIVMPAHKAQAMAKAVLGTSRKKRIQPCNLGVCRESRTISYMWMIATSVIVGLVGLTYSVPSMAVEATPLPSSYTMAFTGDDLPGWVFESLDDGPASTTYEGIPPIPGGGGVAPTRGDSSAPSPMRTRAIPARTRSPANRQARPATPSIFPPET
jgi:hypothetical protein